MAFRTQKISQMTPKGANLEATDLIEVSTIESGSYVTRSITGQEIIDAAVGNVDWGDIGGTLSAQTDLQSALDAKVPTSRTLTINGVTQDLSANRTFTISTGITIGSTAITSGTVGRILFEGAGNVVQESPSLFWDATNNRLGIGTSSPTAIINSVGSVTASSAIARGNFLDNTLVASANNDTTIGLDINSTFTNGAFTGVSNLLLRASIAGTTKASITKDGDIILNGVTGANSPAISVFTSGTSAYFQNYYNPTDNALYWQSVGSYHNATKMVFRNFQQNTGFVVFSNGNTAFGGNPATTTDAGFKLDVNGTARVQGQLTLSNSTFPQLNISGTANNAGIFLNRASTSFASQIRFQTASSDIWTWQLQGNSTNNLSAVRFNGSWLESMTLFYSTGNVGINTTTDAGFRLDVNGTARVSDNLLLTNGIIATSGATTRLQGSLNYFTHNRIASSGVFGFQISSYGTAASFWRFTDSTYDTEIGNPGGALSGGLRLFTAGTERMQITIGGLVLVGTTTAVSSSQFTIESTTRGFLPPRMTTTQKNAIASPAAGLMVYDTTLNVISYYNGSMWI